MRSPFSVADIVYVKENMKRGQVPLHEETRSLRWAGLFFIASIVDFTPFFDSD